MIQFSHLHNHTQYSLLDGASSIDKLYKKALENNMPAVAITDHGNMFGVFKFVAEAWKKDYVKVIGKDENGKDIVEPKIKPIIGCEFYITEDRFIKSFSRPLKDKRYHQLLLAKNEEGYRNLVKMNSLGFIEGYYDKYPRIDKSLIEKYHQGLIATTCCLGAIVPRYILEKSEAEAEKEFEWWLNIFGEDYYIELQRHSLKEQNQVNEVLLKFAKKYHVKVIATNDSHYIDKDDADGHDILLCVNTGEKQNTPGMDDFLDGEKTDTKRRFKFPNEEFYFKTPAQMAHLFQDIPEAIDNTNLIVDKIKSLNLVKEIMLPVYEVPDAFKIYNSVTENQFQFLKELAIQGSKLKYPITTPEIEERLQFELSIIHKMKFSGYFLIVWDFVKHAKEIGVMVGPGRGSVGGSVVAYCIGITNIDPIKYKLLFERFLNPDRNEMPDIDTDFDDEGRQKVLNYVVEKYTKNQVAHIVTYGSMASKSSIKDVARVLDLPLNDSNKLANLVPSKADVKLKDILELPLDNVEEKYQKLNKNKTESDIKTKSTNLVDSKKYNAAQIDNIKELRRYLADKNSLESKVLSKAKELEGSIRNTGVHASAIIIAPKDLTDLIPICISKNTDLFVTQIEGDDIEKSGVIKMDFLGLATLTIIKKALEIIAQVDNIDIDMDKISLTDDKTFKLFQQGDTIGIFQFESEGMQKYLKQMKPDCIDDLVALIALYRPGPMKYIDTYIRRKFGIEKIDYYLPEMKEYLEETLGIFVFQEQVMLMSQKLAGFSKSESDYLRKAMGKKNVKLMEEMRLKFFTKMTEKGYDEIVCNKIWDDWKDFAEYAFNKSHSVAYTFLSYQTGFLKANYREAYLAALLNNAGNAEKIRVFLDDCKKNNIKVLGPDINESDIGFTVNKQKQIRFGLGGIKGLGINTIQDILDERKLHGNFSNLFNLFERLANKTLNKKSIECLVYSGSIDSISEYSRATILNKKDDASKANYEKLLDFVLQKSKLEIENSNSLFSNFTEEVAVKKPEIIACPDWHKLKQINYEKDYTGMYFTGHPLDDYFFELNQLNFTPLNIFNLKKPVTSFNDNTKENADQNNVIDSEEQPEEDIVKFNLNEKIRIGGMITMQQPKISKNGKHYLVFDIEDFTSKTSFTLFSNDYVKYKNFIEGNFKIFIEGSFEFSNFLNRIEFKITKIDLLENIMLQVKGITLKLTPDMVTSEFIHEWETCLSNCKSGSISLRFVIEDFKQGVDIKLLHSKKVSIHEEFKLNIYNKYPQNFEIFL